MTDRITLYGTAWCPWCDRAEKLLHAKGVGDRIDKIDIEQDAEAGAAMMARTGRRTVPQIFVGARHVGGFDELAALDRTGELNALLGL